MKTAKQILIAFDQLVNALLGGWADETLSCRVWREERRAWVSFLDALFFWEKDHCRESYRSERDRLQLPPEFRVNQGSGIRDQESTPTPDASPGFDP
jgi:hypothetical protein